MKRITTLLLVSVLLLVLLIPFATADKNSRQAAQIESEILVEDGIALTDDTIVEYGEDYYLKDEVALYLYAFNELPPNYITKNEAMDLGWTSYKGNLWKVAPGACIGGDRFGNREGLLPRQKGRTYYECDVNYEGGYRQGERIVFSTDGLIYYSEDHYDNFILLYDGWYESNVRYRPAA